MFLEHVNLSVSHLERSIEFYSRVFDWSVRWQGETSSGAPAAHVGNEKNYVALFEATRPGHSPRDYADVGLNHFGFVVEDLDAIRRRLEAAGYPPHAEMDYEPGRRIYFMDPDGIEVEIVQYERAAPVQPH
ncbi:MAG: VOC family protein [Planctomycetota bacterium]|jgi:catechol 2,3-dioxygenase-like lactoylglutathione lyase family enzyme